MQDGNVQLWKPGATAEEIEADEAEERQVNVGPRAQGKLDDIYRSLIKKPITFT